VSRETTAGRSGADPGLLRLADAILIPPFPGSSAPPWILRALEHGLGGVTLFGPNVSAPAEQVRSLTAALREAAAEEPVIAIDEEGGDVTRVAYSGGSSYPGNAALGAVDDVLLTGAVYRAIGGDLAALGVNLNLAPCADVLGSADNPAVGTRSFGADTDLVSRHTAAAVAGLQDAGVAACAKHFPGHGRTATDTHLAVATIEGSLDDLRRHDLPPFLAAIKAGTTAIMPSHLRVPELTGDLPASLSGAAITGLLRGELGFDGVIISDALEMRATRDTFGIPGAAVLAVAAGTDLLCLGRDAGEDDYLAVRAALAAAVRDGTLAGSRLEQAADRVARLRGGLARARRPLGPLPLEPLRSTGVAPGGAGGDGGRAITEADGHSVGVAADGYSVDAAADGRRVGTAADGHGVGLTAARRAVRLSGPRPTLTSPVIVEIEPGENIAAGRFGWGLGPWAPAGSVRRVDIHGGGWAPGPGAAAGARAQEAVAGAPVGPPDAAVSLPDSAVGLPDAAAGLADAAAGILEAAAGILEAAAGRSLVVVVRDAHRDAAARSLVSTLLAARPDAVLVEMGLPLWQPPEGTSYLATYGASRASAQAAAELLGLALRERDLGPQTPR
jgi:beta-N-acetylhexosaminidase